MSKKKKQAPIDTEVKGAEESKRDDRNGQNRRRGGNIFSLKRNDPAWYNTDTMLTKEMQAVSFANKNGARVYRETPGDTPYWYAPGICIIDYYPGPGPSYDATSPLNIASHAMYSYVRHFNSGHANYDVPDLTLYLCATDSIITMIGSVMRAYRICSLYKMLNSYVPDTLLTRLGIDANDFRNNLPEIRSTVNLWIRKMQAFAIPGDLSLFKRHSWLATTVLTDGETEKHQLYAYRNRVYYIYRETTPNRPGYLQAYDTKNLSTWATWRAAIDTMIDTMIQSEDAGIVSGDILKAFGADKLARLAELAPDETQVITFDMDALQQMQNTRTSIGFMVDSLDVWQTGLDGNLYWTPVLDTTVSGSVTDTNLTDKAYYKDYWGPKIINSMVSNPTPEKIIEWTRNVWYVAPRALTPSYIGTAESAAAGTTYTSWINNPRVHAGTEVFGQIHLYEYRDDTTSGTPYTVVEYILFDGQFTVSNDVMGRFTPSATMPEVYTSLAGLACLEGFDFHPGIWLSTLGSEDDGSGGSRSIVHFDTGYHSDISNYAMMERNQMEISHQIAVLAEYKMASMGPWNFTK